MLPSRQDNVMRRKMNIALAVMVILGFGLLIGRLYYLQIVEGEFYKGKALAQQLRPTSISAKRGTIYDRNKKTLATSATVWTVTISPAEIKDDAELNKIADFLSVELNLEKDKII
ncbi:MAG: peptidoglycan glycosyltransferase, partial [Oscillospiraceae bacterium]